MSLQLKSRLSNLGVYIQKNLTLMLFFVLPRNVSNIFVSLSILSLIYDVRKLDLKDHPVDCDKFKSLLQISFNDDIMLLPQYTVHWFWKDEFLNNTIYIDGRQVTVKDALISNEILFKHLRQITEVLLNNIPNSLKIKLQLNHKRERLVVKHNVMNLLAHTG